VQFQQLTRIEGLTLLGTKIALIKGGWNAPHRRKIHISVEHIDEKPKASANGSSSFAKPNNMDGSDNYPFLGAPSVG
jgi:hypothetical protein